MHDAGEQRVEIAEEVLLRAEHTAEVVARAGGEGADRHVCKSHGAGGAFVEGPVSAAGIDAELFSVRGLGADLLRSVQRGLRDVDLDLLFRKLRESRDDLRSDLVGLVAPSRGGIDDKQMLHVSLRLSVFIIHKQIAFDHAVVQLALFVRLGAEAAFELRMRREQI